MTGIPSDMPARDVESDIARITAEADDSRVGLVDIGSSSVRLVIYPSGGRLPNPLFNEREVCRLGAGVGETGRLDPERVKHALGALRRFALIAGNSDLEHFEVFATEAVRKAGNRDEFLKPAEEILGCPIRTISGAEEARYAALGVVSGFAAVDGVAADLGGGSLELQAVNDSVLAEMEPGETSLPLGYLNPLDDETISRALRSLSWTKGRCRGRSLYIVGGAWRAIATTYSARSKKRLDIVHGLTLSMPKLGKMMDAIDAADGEMEGIPPARRPSMRQAIRVLRRLVEALEPSDAVFSSYGVREGILHERLHASRPAADPLLAGVREYAGLWQRHDGLGDALERVVGEFAAVLPKPMRRLARACALLADISWLDYPDYRGRLAVNKMLGLPVVGITHAERVWMAAVLHIRYSGKFPSRRVLKADLTRKEGEFALYTGLVLRMLLNLTGGLPRLVDGLRVEAGGEAVTMHLGEDLAGLRSGLFERRLEAVAEHSPVRILVK